MTTEQSDMQTMVAAEAAAILARPTQPTMEEHFDEWGRISVEMNAAPDMENEGFSTLTALADHVKAYATPAT